MYLSKFSRIFLLIFFVSVDVVFGEIDETQAADVVDFLNRSTRTRRGTKFQRFIDKANLSETLSSLRNKTQKFYEENELADIEAGILKAENPIDKEKLEKNHNWVYYKQRRELENALDTALLSGSANPWTDAFVVGMIASQPKIYEALQDEGVFDALKNENDGAVAEAAKKVGIGLLAVSAESVGKTVNNIVSQNFGSPLERIARVIFGSIGNFSRKIWTKSVKIYYGVQGEPFAHQEVKDFGIIVDTMLEDYKETCNKAVNNMSNRERINRKKNLDDAEEVLEKIDEIVFEITKSHVKKSMDISILGDSKTTILEKIFEAYDKDFIPKELEGVKTFAELINVIQMDSDWKDEREHSLNSIVGLVDYFNIRMAYYSKDKSSMEFRYASMIRERLLEFASMISLATSDKYFGSEQAQRRLRRIRSGLAKNFENLLKYIPNLEFAGEEKKVEAKKKRTRPSFGEYEEEDYGFNRLM